MSTHVERGDFPPEQVLIPAAEFKAWVAQIPDDGFVGLSDERTLFFTDKEYNDDAIGFYLGDNSEDEE